MTLMVYFKRAEFWHRTGAAAPLPGVPFAMAARARRVVAECPPWVRHWRSCKRTRRRKTRESERGGAARRVQKHKRVAKPLMVALPIIMIDETRRRPGAPVLSSFVFLDTTRSKRPGAPVLSSFVLLDRTPQNSGDARLVRAFVKKLRRKLGDVATSPAYIVTEPRVGYRMPKAVSSEPSGC